MDNPRRLSTGMQKVTYLTDDSGIRVIRAGKLIDGTGAPPIENATIVIQGQRILSISRPGDGVTCPESPYEVVDASRNTVMPGMIDLHIHCFGERVGERGGGIYRRYLAPSRDVKTIIAALDVPKMLDAGFTTVRDVGWGPGLALQKAINDGILDGPRILASGLGLSQTGGHGDLPVWPEEWVRTCEPRGRLADGVDECRKAVRRNLREGADLIKLYTSASRLTDTPEGMNLSTEEVQAIVQEAHRAGMKVACHALGRQGVESAILGGVDTIEHCILRPEDYDLLEMMADKGIVLSATLAVFYWVANLGGNYGFMEREIEITKEDIKLQMAGVRKAHELGVRIGVGSDAQAQFVGMNALELELLVECGLSPMEAIVAVTKTGAEAMGLGKYLGTIEPGKLADIIVVDGDPLEDIRVLQNTTRILRILKTMEPLKKRSWEAKYSQ